MDEMSGTEFLGDFHRAVLMGVLRAGADAYGLRISGTIREATGRELALARVYTALDQLETRGLVSSSDGEPTPERGGRSKRCYQLTASGLRTVGRCEPTGGATLRGLVTEQSLSFV
jgi:DNA-binding PadR family transcriptional regulator